MPVNTTIEDKAYQIYRGLKTKKPFTYKIGDKLYYIGCAICRECSSEETGVYEEYRKEFENACVRLNRNQSVVSKKDFVKLENIIEKILNFDGSIYCDANKHNEYKKLCVLLQGMTETELEELEKQMNDFFVSLDLMDGSFYKYLPEKRMTNQ